MGTLDTICGSHALEALLFLAHGPRLENDFREILGFYGFSRPRCVGVRPKHYHTLHGGFHPTRPDNYVKK